MYYNFNGVDANGDTQVDLFPIPKGIENIFFNLYKPQPTLTDPSTTLLVPSDPVAKYAYAKAVAERGEDGGLLSCTRSKCFSRYVTSRSHRYGRADRTIKYVWEAV